MYKETVLASSREDYDDHIIPCVVRYVESSTSKYALSYIKMYNNYLSAAPSLLYNAACAACVHVNVGIHAVHTVMTWYFTDDNESVPRARITFYTYAY